MKSFWATSILLLLFLNIQAQVLRVSVGVQNEHLSNEEQRNLQDLKSDVEDYFNNYSWTEDEYETDVEVNIYIIIETVTEKSHEKMYRSQFQIKSISGESFYDKEWEFPFYSGYSMEHSKAQFDPLCNFLDFYAYMILAGELDTYGLNLGTPFYEKALDIANRGAISKYTKGWNERIKELQKITHIRTRPLREAKPDFFEAEYLLRQGKKADAKVLALKVLDAIEKVVQEQPNNKYLKLFFDAHYRTFIDIFQGDAQNLQRLVNFDNTRREAYKEAM